MRGLPGLSEYGGDQSWYLAPIRHPTGSGPVRDRLRTGSPHRAGLAWRPPTAPGSSPNSPTDGKYAGRRLAHHDVVARTSAASAWCSRYERHSRDTTPVPSPTTATDQLPGRWRNTGGQGMAG